MDSLSVKSSNDVTDDVFAQTQRLCHDWFDLCRQVYFETWNCKTLFSNLLVLQTIFEKMLSDRATLLSCFLESQVSDKRLDGSLVDERRVEQGLARLFNSLCGEANYETCYNKMLCFLEQYEYAELLPLKEELKKEGEALHCECCFAAANAEWYACNLEQDSDQEEQEDEEFEDKE